MWFHSNWWNYTKSTNHPGWTARRNTSEKPHLEAMMPPLEGLASDTKSHVQKQWRIRFFFSGVDFLAHCPCPHVLKDMKSSKWDQSKLSSPIFRWEKNIGKHHLVLLLRGPRKQVLTPAVSHESWSQPLQKILNMDLNHLHVLISWTLWVHHVLGKQ